MKQNRDMEKSLSLDNEKTNEKKKNKKPSKFVAFFTSKKAKRGSIAVLLTVIFIAVIVGLNILTTMLTDRYSSLTVDFTANKLYKLTDESLKQTANINKDVTVYVLTDESTFESINDYYLQINKLLHEFEKNSEHITLEYITPASDPTFAQKYSDINWYTSSYVMLVECGENYIGVQEEDLFEYTQDESSGEYVVSDQKLEQALLSAILNVMTTNTVGVTFLELDTNVDPTYFMSVLSNNAFNVGSVSLLSEAIPEDSKFVVMYAPTSDIGTNEYEALTKWLENDGEYGHTLVYIANPLKYTQTPNIDLLLENWSMVVTDGWVYEQDESYMSLYADEPQIATLFNYENAEFTKTLRSTSLPVIISRCRPIEIIDSGASTMLTTSESAVICPFSADASWTPSQEQPQKLNGAAISTHGNEDFTKKSNIIAIGSVDAFSDVALTSANVNNLEYFLNMFNTIADRENIALTIEGKPLYENELGTTSASTINALVVLVRYIIPIAVIIAGIAMWIYRRKKNG